MSSERTASVAAALTPSPTTVPVAPGPPAPHLRHDLPPPTTGPAVTRTAPAGSAGPVDTFGPAPSAPTILPGETPPRHAARTDALPATGRHSAGAARTDVLPVTGRHSAGATGPGPRPRHGAARTRSAGSGRTRRLPTDSWPFWVELPVLLFVAFTFAFLIKTFVVQPFFIPSGSMEDTLNISDRVLVNKLVYHTRPIERGDIVVFDGADSFSPEVAITSPTNPLAKAAAWLGSLVGFAPPNQDDFIKRVIGVGGDHVKCCDAQGRVTVNGIPLDERSYLYPGDSPSDQPFDVVVPAGKLWVMGDHRSGSSDSRAHLGDPGGGFVPEDQVIGRAFAVIWPLADRQILSIPTTFEQPALSAPAGP